MATREAISKLTREIFGQLPNRQIRTGHQNLKKRLTGVLDARYYPESIDSIARMVCSCCYFCEIVYINIRILNSFCK